MQILPRYARLDDNAWEGVAAQEDGGLRRERPVRYCI